MITDIEYSNQKGFFLAVINFKNGKGLQLMASKKVDYGNEETINSPIAKKIYNFKITEDDILSQQEAAKMMQKIDKLNDEFSYFINKVNFDLVKIISDIYATNPEEVRHEITMDKMISKFNQNGITWKLKISGIY